MPKAKLTYQQIDEICALLTSSALSMSEIASRYGVSRETISSIAIGKTHRRHPGVVAWMASRAGRIRRTNIMRRYEAGLLDERLPEIFTAAAPGQTIKEIAAVTELPIALIRRILRDNDISPSGRLNNKIVELIRQRAQAGESQRKLAAEYGVRESTISRIVNRNRRKHEQK